MVIPLPLSFGAFTVAQISMSDDDYWNGTKQEGIPQSLLRCNKREKAVDLSRFGDLHLFGGKIAP